MNDQLKKFCKEIRPPDDHIELSRSTIKSLISLLSAYSRFPIAYYVIGGGLGKETSTGLKCDVDVTIYTPWSLDKAQGSLAVGIPYQKELVLDDWWRIIFDNTEPDSWDDVIHRTTNSLNFNYKGIMIDLLVAFCFFQDSQRQRSYILQILRVTHRLCQTARRLTVIKLIKKFQSELTVDGVKWMKKKSSFVSDVARLAKFWSQTVLFVGCGSGKSFFIELLACKAALSVEEEKVSSEDTKYYSSFVKFLLMVKDMKDLRIVFEDLYTKDSVPDYVLEESPLLLNPVNPFQNMFEVVDDHFMETMSQAASETLLRLHSEGAHNFCYLFKPQTKGNLLTMRKVKCYLEDSDVGNFMPRLTINCDWLKPLLNRSCEKVIHDNNKMTRYFVGRAVRLIGSFVKCCDVSNVNTTDMLDMVQELISELNCNKGSKINRDEAMEEVNSRRDVDYIVTCNGGSKVIKVSFDVIVNAIYEIY